MDNGYEYPLAKMKGTRAEKIEVLEQISNYHLPIIQGEVQDNRTAVYSESDVSRHKSDTGGYGGRYSFKYTKKY